MSKSSELVAALARAGVAGAEADNRRRAEYSSDASNYRVPPAVVVFPRSTYEVVTIVEIARNRGMALTCRGGGTSIAGNAIGPGMVIDFSRHLGRVLEIDVEARTARVEPGAILDSITTAAVPYGLRFGPDPSSHARATIGGSIGNNACGSRALRYGRTSDNVVNLDLLTSSGQLVQARRLGPGGLASIGTLGDQLEQVVAERQDVIRKEFGRFRRQVSGYSLEHLLAENGPDLARFVVGSEGTLAVVLEATVRLTPSPAAVALAVLAYPDIATAADAAAELVDERVVALEGLDAGLVELVRRHRGAAGMPSLPQGGAWIFAETSGTTLAEARTAAEQMVAGAGCAGSAVLTGEDARALWRIREDGAGLGSRTSKGEPAWPGWEDAAVPPRHLGAYLRQFQSLMSHYGLEGLLYGHFGDGCLHVRIDFPLMRDRGRYREFVVEAARLVSHYQGSMSGEHGDGRARSEMLGYMYSAEALSAFAQVKRIFDPGNVLNPGVIVDAARIDQDMRLASVGPLRRRLGFSYPDDQDNLATAVHRCVGIGKCRADGTGAGEVMCPSYLATGDEKDSTRGRSRVLQELANGSLVKGFDAPEIDQALDLCLSCKGCYSDCPAGVDMATYKAEILYQRYHRRLRPAAHYALGWIPRHARVAAKIPRTANAVLRQPSLAAMAKRAGGVDSRRDLPLFARQSFRRWFAGHRPAPGTPVLLWVDTFTQHFSPEVGRAAVGVLEDAGLSVQVTAKQVCCGLTWISTGQLDSARRQLGRSLDALQPFLQRGVPIVGLEPSCTAVLRKDAAELLPDDRRTKALQVATRTLAELLPTLAGWVPPRLSGLRALAQPHCHHHAVMGWEADAALLRSAGAELESVGGCCGLAGNFGFERGHYDTSVAVAETALLPAVRRMKEGTVVLADGFSCRTQLEQLAGQPALHLAQLLECAADHESMRSR